MNYLRIIQIILLYFIVNSINAQSNHFFKENARWVYFTNESFEPGQLYSNSSLEEITTKGDTLINGSSYQKVYKRFKNTQTSHPPFPFPSSSSSYFTKEGPFFIRYDETNGKLYYKSHPDSLEYIIYDNTLKVGDLLPPKSNFNNRNTILKLDTISIFGNVVQHFNTDTNNVQFKNGAIKGIGGLNGFEKYQPKFLAVSGGIEMTELVCFEYEGKTLLLSNFTNVKCPSNQDFTTSTTEISNYNIKLYPNPSDGNFKLNVSEEIIGSNISFYNLLGLEVLKLKINQESLDISLDDSGIYLFIIEKEGRQIYRSSAVINK